MMKKLYFLISIFCLFVGVVGGVEAARAAQLPALNVFISSDRVQQADTLLVVVKNTTVAPTGRLGLVPLRFFQDASGTWKALPGIAVGRWPGTYKLIISVPGYQTITKNIVITKRAFPVTTLAITPKLQQQGYTAKKIVDTVKNHENVLLQKALQPISSTPYSTKPFINPLQEIVITGNYGDIRKAGAIKIQHLGVDLKAPVGTPVLAVNDGKVVFERSLPDYGNTLVVDHGLGVYSLYLHLSQYNVAEGDMVTQGQTIALAGDTGYAIGPHLHFSMKVRGASVDPLKFIETSAIQH